jgi:SAM-dependent methyltransferase
MGPYSVLDIGCNDGSQLDAFKELLFKTHGVDPAENLYPTSSAKHNVVLGFWDSISANLLGQEFDVITTQNAFAHIPDPLSYLKLAKTYLKTDGKIFISTSQSDMVLNREFDTIYHEHISYYNVESMKALAERAGLHLIDVVKTPIHGTSYVFVLSKQPHNRERIENSLAIEARLHSGETYRYWAAGTKHTLQRLRVTIDTYKDIGYRIVGYGAAAKGMTLLNASRIPLDVVVDDNSLKQGLWCPGTHVPVVGPEYIKNIDPMTKILFVPLAWNFYTEISRKILAIRNQPGDTFIRYFPELQIDTVGLNEHQH